ncbi:DUF1617 family protein [Clostridium algidicarnis]|uniref:DUF1617 family protein n=1 Tax=Clostridium algidicarnis TaxID=37659 RepID=UPI001623AAF9|nr:DUF1617 family protein [Clostridium algidicarnis]MBB6696240.1 DUF1617 family protein [Clostridium algidicarnis]MBU3205565.1 DUF1617 family protein [Clostridium algidicarnis]
MKLSNERIVGDMAKLSDMANKELPVKVSYAIAKNISRIENEMKVYDTEKQKLIEKYSEKNAEGKPLIDADNNIKIQNTNIDDWNRDIRELLSIENEIEIQTFNINELEGYSMTPIELMPIDYMIEE